MRDPPRPLQRAQHRLRIGLLADERRHLELPARGSPRWSTASAARTAVGKRRSLTRVADDQRRELCRPDDAFAWSRHSAAGFPASTASGRARGQPIVQGPRNRRGGLIEQRDDVAAIGANSLIASGGSPGACGRCSIHRR
jgi:hypothetical protein